MIYDGTEIFIVKINSFTNLSGVFNIGGDPKMCRGDRDGLS
jgi:hypothetical protein